MSCRFTITEKWKDLWFRKLSLEAKLLFLYLVDNCDVAGFLEIDLERISFDTGLPLKEEGIFDNCKATQRPLGEVFEELKKAYIKDGNLIWIRNFLYHQKNLPLNPLSSFHKGIIKIINSHNSFGNRVLREIDKIIKKRSWRGLREVSETSKVIDIGNSNKLGNSKEGIVKGGKNNNPAVILSQEKELFNSVIKIYPGVKRGKETEFNNFQKHKDWKQALPFLMVAIEKQIAWRRDAAPSQFKPEWKHFKTWINQRCWEDELPICQNSKQGINNEQRRHKISEQDWGDTKIFYATQAEEDEAVRLRERDKTGVSNGS